MLAGSSEGSKIVCRHFYDDVPVLLKVQFLDSVFFLLTFPTCFRLVVWDLLGRGRGFPTCAYFACSYPQPVVYSCIPG